MIKATQKQMESGLKVWAYDLGRKASIRRNAHGEYETRISVWGKRNDTITFISPSFDEAHLAGEEELERIEDAQRAEGERRKLEHEKTLATVMSNFGPLFSSLNLTLFMRDHVVTMISPKTGTHLLNMAFGVRPISDLVPHLCGFIEAQTHYKA